MIIFTVIIDCGDGSNYVQYVTDPKVIDKMEQLVDSGDEQYASGDGLQVKALWFPDDFNIQEWFDKNHILPKSMEDFDE